MASRWGTILPASIIPNYPPITLIDHSAEECAPTAAHMIDILSAGASPTITSAPIEFIRHQKPCTQSQEIRHAFPMIDFGTATDGF